MRFSKEITYFLLVILASVISLSKSGLIAYFLNPVNFGYFSIFLILTGYFQYSQFGILNGLGRELPISLGKKDNQRSEILIEITKNTLIIFQSLTSAFLVLFLIFINFESEIYYYLVLLALFTSWISNFFQLSMLRLRSELRIIEFSVINFIVSFFGLMLTCYFSIKFGLFGAIFGTVIVLLIAFCYTDFFLLTRSRLMKNVLHENFFQLLKTGFPMIAGTFIQTLLFSLDKILVLNFFSIEKLGLYSFASLPLVIGIGLSGMINTYFTPKILHEFGADNNKHKTYQLSRNISLILIIAGILLFPLFYLLTNYLLNNFFLEYIQIKNLLLFFYFPALLIASNTFAPTLMASGQMIFMFIYELCILLFALPFFLYISINNLDLIYFPITMFVFLFIGFLVCMFFAKKKSLMQTENI